MIDQNRTTIFALSSGQPPAGIAIIRVSGPRALSVLRDFVDKVPPERQLALRRLSGRTGQHIDTAMVVHFPEPNSATGDDMVEFHVHGGPAVVAAMLRELSERPDLTSAKRGDFIRRAFDNGRMTRDEIEDLADLIEAETEGQRELALRDTSNALLNDLDKWRTSLVDLYVSAEAELNFADERDVPQYELNSELLIKLRDQLSDAMAGSKRGALVRDGLTVALVGPVNAGKSSLMNILAARQIAIVTEFPGTTRDVIEARLDLDGIMINLLDTAGTRETQDTAELVGIERGIERAAFADLVIAIDDPARSADLHLISKCDQINRSAGWYEDTLYVSSVTNDGIDLLLDWLTKWAANSTRIKEPFLLMRERHVHAVSEAINEINLATATNDLVLLVEHLKSALHAVDTISVKTSSDKIMNKIFSRFCIGK